MEVKTRYNIGDEVWTMHNNRPHCFRIAGIEVFRNSLRTFDIVPLQVFSIFQIH